MINNLNKRINSLIISTLGFTPNLIISERILTFFTENLSINLLVKKPISFIILYPNLKDIGNQRSFAIKTLKKRVNYNLNFFEINIDNFELASIQILENILSFIDKFEPYKQNVFFNLSGGINFLILAAFTVSHYIPTNKIFFFIESTEIINILDPIAYKLKLDIHKRNILKIFDNFDENLNLKQIVDRLSKRLVYNKDKSNTFRQIKNMIDYNLMQRIIHSPKKIDFKLSLHGYLNKLSLEYFSE